jgi:hypothetical protein
MVRAASKNKEDLPGQAGTKKDLQQGHKDTKEIFFLCLCGWKKILP